MQTTRYSKLECKSSGKTVTNYSCNIKAISRNLTVFNVKGMILRTTEEANASFLKFFDPVIVLITNFQVDFALYYGYFSNWRQIIRLPKFEICNMIKTAANTQGIGQIVTNFLNKTEGTNLRCPLKNGTIFKITNYTESAKGFMNLPSGNYKVEFSLSNDYDDMIFEFKLKYSIKTSGTDKYEF